MMRLSLLSSTFPERNAEMQLILSHTLIDSQWGRVSDDRGKE